MSRLFLIFIAIQTITAFKFNPLNGKIFGFSLLSTVASEEPTSKTWQEDLDQILNVDTSCGDRRNSSLSLITKAREVTEDFISAIQEQDIEKIAPKNLLYGKAVVGLQSFRKQLVSDIIPDIFTKTVPKLIDEGPKLINNIIEKGPSQIIQKGEGLITKAREIYEEPSRLQSTVEEVRKEFNNVPNILQSTVIDIQRELRNVVKSTPEGLEQPSYVVVKSTENYELRMYSPYTVCSSPISNSEIYSADAISMDPFVTSNSFNKLFSYISGANTVTDENGALSSTKISMTVPVIIEQDSLNFVLPKNITAANAPFPESDMVTIKDIPSELVAVREFTGIATENESNRQCAKLEDALISDGIVYESSSFKVFQYNPPYTLPWVRRNEVSFKVKMSDFISGQVNNVITGAAEFFTAPEAGD